MSAERVKVFGMDLGVDPKVIVLVLLVTAGIVFYFTSSSSSSDASVSTSNNTPSAVVPVPGRPALNPALNGRAAAQRNHISADRETLRLVAVDGSHGDIDPTLRLSLLESVKNVPPAAGLRNLFEAGGPVIASSAPPPPIIKNAPILVPKPGSQPIVVSNQPPPPPAFSIPLKYYGFAKSKSRSVDGSRGLFLDGDSILIGGEGDILERQFLIVALTPTSARLEDTKARQRQDIPVTPEAAPVQ